MIRMRELIYIGNDHDMLNELINNEKYLVKKCICVSHRISDGFIQTLRDNNIEEKIIVGRPDWPQLLVFCQGIELIVMYKFEHILPKSMILEHCIVNFHGGSLYDNRGGNAVVWSILNGDKNTCLSMYELTGGIDEGKLIGEYHVDIDLENETPITLNTKLKDGIPRLMNMLDEYLLGNRKANLVLGGKYVRKVKETDYTIDLNKDAIELIKRKIRSQMAYKGAIVEIDGVIYRTERYSNIETDGQRRRIEFDGVIMKVFDEKEAISVVLMKE